MVDLAAKWFLQGLQDNADCDKLMSILSPVSKEEAMAWTDEDGLDFMHYCILLNRVDMVDLLLKQMYFARPFQPKINLYVHLAALLGLRSVLNVLVNHRPDDCRVCQQPLYIPPSFNIPKASRTPQARPPQDKSSNGDSSGLPKSPAATRPGKSLTFQRALSDWKNIQEPKSPRGTCSSPSGYPKSLLAWTCSSPDTCKSSIFPRFCKEPEKAKLPKSPGEAACSSPEKNVASSQFVNVSEKSAGVSSPGVTSPGVSSLGKSILSSPKVFNESERTKAPNSPDASSPGKRSTSPKGERSGVPKRQGVTSAGRRRTPSPKAYKEPEIDGGPLCDRTTPLRRTPWYVAARAGRLDCLRLLLDLAVLKTHPDAPNKGYLTLAALADCPCCMQLLIKYVNEDDKELISDYRAAVTLCVQTAQTQCLALLLDNEPPGADLPFLFKQINFFHVLYTFSATYGKGVYARLPEATRLLISRGHSVRAAVPPRTYPLYTLLTHSLSYHETGAIHYYRDCLKLLLDAGADPNFDEVAFEKYLLREKGIKFAAGRNAYSSALHCLIETVESVAGVLKSRALAVSFVEDCADILVSHDAQISKVGHIGDSLSTMQGTMLHQFAKSAVTIGLDQGILKCILRYGGDPDDKVNGKYAVNVYLDKLFEKLSLSEETEPRDQSEVKDTIAALCYYMNPNSIREAALVFRRSHARNQSQQAMFYFSPVLQDLNRRAKTVPPLSRICAWRIWKYCDKRSSLVRELPVKVGLKTQILPLLCR